MLRLCLNFYFNFNVYIFEYHFKILNKLKYIKLVFYLNNIFNITVITTISMLKTYHYGYIADKQKYYFGANFKLFLIKNKTWQIKDWLWGLFLTNIKKNQMK